MKNRLQAIWRRGLGIVRAGWAWLVAAWLWVRSFGLYNSRLAQAGHFLAGIVVADWFGAIGCAAFTGGWILPKEVVLDPRPPERDKFLWGGATDALFYCLGMAVGLARRWYLGI